MINDISLTGSTHEQGHHRGTIGADDHTVLSVSRPCLFGEIDLPPIPRSEFNKDDKQNEAQTEPT